ncbi:sperm acrosome membrane-associated protein 6 isoform X5 [Eptesicus fuscus]|uniref:sperm acrosome membrane-associated protein 6 isoform X5 n=1 Tax=Eptesicus fuscus TaxID=29078 RepID=UPI0024048A90|nr:sperm acrosome membrane-associated protein 6 isoform X5 [Eptesicus fuscus]
MAPRAAASAVPCALVALAALGPPAWACLLCFTSYSERHRICRIFVGVEGPEVEKCEKAFSAAFEGLLDTEINYDERSHLHDSFTQMTFSLQEIATAQGSYEVAFPYAAEKIQEVIAQLKEVQACIPPCGHQELSRRFRCLGCYSRVCDFPLDCPIQDVTVQRGDQALFSCTVKFQLPKEEIAYSWKFAEGGADSGHVLLPRYAPGPRVPGADPASAAHAQRDLLLRDRTRPAPAGAPLLLSERDGPSPARGDRAPGRLSGSASLGAARGGGGRTLEAEPGRAAGRA